MSINYTYTYPLHHALSSLVNDQHLVYGAGGSGPLQIGKRQVMKATGRQIED